MATPYKLRGITRKGMMVIWNALSAYRPSSKAEAYTGGDVSRAFREYIEQTESKGFEITRPAEGAQGDDATVDVELPDKECWKYVKHAVADAPANKAVGFYFADAYRYVEKLIEEAGEEAVRAEKLAKKDAEKAQAASH